MEHERPQPRGVAFMTNKSELVEISSSLLGHLFVVVCVAITVSTVATAFLGKAAKEGTVADTSQCKLSDIRSGLAKVPDNGCNF